MNPVQLFDEWLSEELKHKTAGISTACCLSTIGLDGYPNARFVSLKETHNNRFIITGPLNSRKGLEIKINGKVALAFWWTATERQVRIQGTATIISHAQAEKYFSDRSFESQIVSTICEQGKPLTDIAILNEKFIKMKSEHEGKTITCPQNWGGFSIKPLRFEFMEFKQSRFHERKTYEQKDGQWFMEMIQP